MPTISDTTVVASAYDTSGNGGRKLVRLSNGWLVAVAIQASTAINFYVSKDNGSTWSQLCYASLSVASYCVSLVNVGTRVYAIGSNNTSNNTAASLSTWTFDATTVTNIALTGVTLDSSQNTMGNCSLAINDTGTELHATWASKNSSYTYSFNIRYAKGTINADGNVTWSAVEQVTAYSNNGYANFTQNPSIVITNGLPTILAEQPSGVTFSGTTVSAGNCLILVLKRDTSLGTNPNMDSNWTYKAVFATNSSSYPQFSPSAIFVPQSINGLANGRIEVGWHGTDATDSGVNNIRSAYSDDGGVTWTVRPKITSGNTLNRTNVTLTASKDNKVYILYGEANTNFMIYKSLNFGVPTVVVSNAGTSGPVSPSSLYDPTLNFTEPLFIYRNIATTKVGFYGTWTFTTISVTQGDIGTKSDKANLLTYSITTDGTMSTITEKVNGTTIGTKTTTSGQSLIAGLTQTQWDAVRFGKYNQPITTDLISLKTSSSWEQGGYTGTSAGQTPTQSASTTILRLKSGTDKLQIQPNTTYTVNIASGFKLFIIEVNSSNVTIQSVGYLTNGQTYTSSVSATHVYLQMRNTSDSTIVATDVNSANPSLVNTSFPSNTLTIEMGTETWTYTFDKRLATDADILSAVKAVQDSQTTFIPAVKSELASAITARGGTSNASDSFGTMINAISTAGKAYASGSVTGGTTAMNLTWVDGTAGNGYFYPVTVTGLTFKPKRIILTTRSSYSTTVSVYSEDTYDAYPKSVKVAGTTTGNYQSSAGIGYVRGDVSPCSVTSTGFTLPCQASGVTVYWEAYE